MSSEYRKYASQASDEYVVDSRFLHKLKGKNKLKPLAFYLLVKFRSKSIIYNYNPSRLSRLTGLHPNTVKSYVKFLTANNLVTLHGKNLRFLNQQTASGYLHTPINGSMCRYFHNRINKGTFKHILNQLYYHAINGNRLQQLYNAGKKYGEENSKRHIKTDLLEDEVSFSSRGIGRLLGVTATTALQIVNKLEKLKLISVREKLIRVDRKSWYEYQTKYMEVEGKKVKYQHRFHKGLVYKHYGLSIVPIHKESVHTKGRNRYNQIDDVDRWYKQRARSERITIKRKSPKVIKRRPPQVQLYHSIPLALSTSARDSLHPLIIKFLSETIGHEMCLTV